MAEKFKRGLSFVSHMTLVSITLAFVVVGVLTTFGVEPGGDPIFVVPILFIGAIAAHLWPENLVS
jgi:hypothetical protein